MVGEDTDHGLGIKNCLMSPASLQTGVRHPFNFAPSPLQETRLRLNMESHTVPRHFEEVCRILRGWKTTEKSPNSTQVPAESPNGDSAQ